MCRIPEGIWPLLFQSSQNSLIQDRRVLQSFFVAINTTNSVNHVANISGTINSMLNFSARVPLWNFHLKVELLSTDLLYSAV